MTVLDQAFIKAYLRQGGVSRAEAEPSAPAQCAEDIVATDVFHAEQAPPAASEVPADLPAADSAGVSEEPLPSGGPFAPRLRIDTVSWPEPSRRLQHEAGQQIEHLAEAVLQAAEAGRKLIGVAGFSHGEGCTTVLLAVARKLVQLDRNILVLDADVARPRLAHQLGMAAESGWLDVALGRIDLEDAVTESETESLALLPYRGETTEDASEPPSVEAIDDTLDRVAGHYDVVLVDLGGSLTSGGEPSALAGQVAERIDSVLTVQNIRTTSHSHLAMLRQHFRRLGVAETGVIENFVDVT